MTFSEEHHEASPHVLVFSKELAGKQRGAVIISGNKCNHREVSWPTSLIVLYQIELISAFGNFGCLD